MILVNKIFVLKRITVIMNCVLTLSHARNDQSTSRYDDVFTRDKSAVVRRRVESDRGSKEM